MKKMIGTLCLLICVFAASSILAMNVGAEATMNITANNVTATYDGKAHGVSVISNPAGATIKYRNTDGTYDLTESPTLTEVGTTTVYYQASLDGYPTVTGSATVTINARPITITADNQSWSYDGKNHVWHYWTVETPTVPGENVTSVHFDGSITYVGSESNIPHDAQIVRNDGKDMTVNYDINYVDGTLTITGDPVTLANTATTPNNRYALGDIIPYTITVKNMTNVTLTNVTAEAQSGSYLVAGDGYTLTNGIITIPTIPFGDVVTLNAAHIVNSSDILKGSHENTVNIKVGNKTISTIGSTDYIVEPDATMAVTLTSDVPDGSKATLGKTIHYTIAVTNNGNVPFSNLNVTDSLTGGTWTVETLAVNETKELNTGYTVVEANVNAGKVVNTVAATGDQIENPKDSENPKTPTGSDEIETPVKNRYNITYQITGNYFAADSYRMQLDVKFGEIVSEITDNMTQANYVWSGWVWYDGEGHALGSVPTTMPAYDLTVKGYYTPVYYPPIVITPTAPVPGMDHFTIEKTYSGYPDVPDGKWYGDGGEGCVGLATRLGIMDGYDDGSFRPESKLKVCEAVKIACVIHSIYMADGYDFTQSTTPWYQVYVDYALTNGILAKGVFTDYEAVCTRTQAAYILGSALPAKELTAINEVNSLPDVTTSSEYANQIFLLYRAGVLCGMDSSHTFGGTGSFTRAEACAIITRLCLPDNRISF